ncbi:XRE family transcriptional regulator [Roseomonas nepalensis]|uniref:XRE family transcriptional regulator n=1 Tax=Muricoccus nepalensis TaxID=1854500 RepID=A0A502F8H5_9PROT|nr:helix-turn-helix transcriptional regulator [Roseomonas nepalensis]TPG45684.1 XRE family transcriptional regulator [Roseomonas nepalensis]
MLNVSPAQSRAARALLNWSQDELATKASVGVNTVRNFEQEKASPRPAILTAMRSALERAGIQMIEDEGEGVKLRKTTE